MASVALINYYARLLRKDQVTLSSIPSDMRDQVLEALEKLKSEENK